MLTISVLCFLFVLASTAVGKPRPKLQHSARFLVAQQLNIGLAGTPMRGLGFKLEAAGHRYGVHPAFIAAVAGLESSYGAEGCRDNRLNAYGLGSCRASCARWARSWVPCFNTWGQSIGFFARWFVSRWRPGTSVWTVGYTFCPPCGFRWGSKVAYNMRRLGFTATTRYGL